MRLSQTTGGHAEAVGDGPEAAETAALGFTLKGMAGYICVMEVENNSTTTLAKQGVTAIGRIISGAFCLAASAAPPLISIVLGGIAAVVGLGAFFSRDPDDKKIGGIVAVGGFLALAAKLPASPAPVRAVAGTLLFLGAVGFLTLGIWKGLAFLRRLKARG
ncbi:MAG: hypothetical protein LBD24_03015 [Spirochaetaceae bacterium]|nr:hypothetical protein [Spirochaetaceae bacterium]